MYSKRHLFINQFLYSWKLHVGNVYECPLSRSCIYWVERVGGRSWCKQCVGPPKLAVGGCLMSDGKLFQSRGAATASVLSPKERRYPYTDCIILVSTSKIICTDRTYNEVIEQRFVSKETRPKMDERNYFCTSIHTDQHFCITFRLLVRRATSSATDSANVLRWWWQGNTHLYSPVLTCAAAGGGAIESSVELRVWSSLFRLCCRRCVQLETSCSSAAPSSSSSESSVFRCSSSSHLLIIPARRYEHDEHDVFSSFMCFRVFCPSVIK